MDPLKIFEINDEGNLQFHLDRIIKVVDEIPPDIPIAILSIVGTKRLGKSFVLNKLLDHFLNLSCGVEFEFLPPARFASGGGSERVTAGIDAWPKPIILQNGPGKLALLLLDCQGDSDSNTYIPDNVIIFTIAQLLSSMMMYNLQGQIDEKILQQYVFMANYAHEINREASGGRYSLPKVMFLLRDFQFESEFGLGLSGPGLPPKSSKNYFDSVFGEITNMPLENLDVRRRFLEIFKEPQIFMLPHPGRNFVWNREEFAPEEDFDEQIAKLPGLVQNNLEPKKVDSKIMTKSQLCALLKQINQICRNCVSQPVEITKTVANLGELEKSGNTEGKCQKRETTWIRNIFANYWKGPTRLIISWKGIILGLFCLTLICLRSCDNNKNNYYTYSGFQNISVGNEIF